MSEIYRKIELISNNKQFILTEGELNKEIFITNKEPSDSYDTLIRIHQYVDVYKLPTDLRLQVRAFIEDVSVSEIESRDKKVDKELVELKINGKPYEI